MKAAGYKLTKIDTTRNTKGEKAMTDEPNRLIIENRSSASMFTALSFCQSVIDEGRVSNSRHGPMYCGGTRIRNRDGEFIIWADRNKKSDRLVVQDWEESK